MPADIKAEATPRPWRFEDGFILAEEEALRIVGVQIPTVVGPARLEAVANAALIVRAVNSHDALVKALQGAQRIINGFAAYEDRVGHTEDAAYHRAFAGELDALLKQAGAA